MHRISDEPLPRPSRRDVLAGLSSLGATGAARQASGAAVAASPAQSDALVAYFKAHARELLRPAAGVLRSPSISPSLPKATYSSDLWDWDTLWTARGLLRLSELTHDAALRQDVLLHAAGSLNNFFDHQSEDGRIPMLITVKDADPLGCLRGPRPHKENQAKPVLAQLALLVADARGTAQWFAPHLAGLKAFYESWRVDNLSHTGLLVWGDDVAIGNDNDPTTFGRPFFSSANLLLNCLYYQDLKAAAELSRRLEQQDEARLYDGQAADLAVAIQKHCWDPRDRFFYTADVQCKDRRAELIPNIPAGMAMSWNSLPLRIQTFTGFLPMWCGLATRAQNVAMVRHLQDLNGIGARYGVRTLSRAETMYSLVASSNPSNWLGPVWIIANYLVWAGLRRNGFAKEAQTLGSATIALLARDLAGSGSLNEYYHPDTGAPLSHRNFVDWNMLVLEMMPA
jgi:putative isomerase